MALLSVVSMIRHMAGLLKRELVRGREWACTHACVGAHHMHKIPQSDFSFFQISISRFSVASAFNFSFQPFPDSPGYYNIIK